LLIGELYLSDGWQYTTQLQEEGDYIVSLHMREALEDLIYENQVNLMLVGHQHSYGGQM
jgi:hypothetical protein